MNTQEKLNTAFERLKASYQLPPELRDHPFWRNRIVCDSVPEYERRPVYIEPNEGVIEVCAINEGGFNSTAIDLAALIDWMRVNMPEVLNGDDGPPPGSRVLPAPPLSDAGTSPLIP